MYSMGRKRYTHPHRFLDGGEEVLGTHGEGLLLAEVEGLGVVVHQLGGLCVVRVRDLCMEVCLLEKVRNIDMFQSEGY